MSLAGAGVLTLPVACTLVLGANLGGAIPAVDRDARRRAAARRVTVGNLVFKLIGCIALLPLIELALPPLAS